MRVVIIFNTIAFSSQGLTWILDRGMATVHTGDRKQEYVFM